MNTVNNFPRAFVREYVKNGFNGTQAYLALRPTVTENSAGVLAHRTLRLVKTMEAMAEITDSILTVEETKGLISKYAKDDRDNVRPSAVRSTELMAKVHKMIDDRALVQVNVGLGQVNDAVLAALARLETPVAIGEGKS